MAKEVAIGKRAKISEAQQYMILAVLGASIFLGVAISLIIYFVKCISFNNRVIAAQEQSIVSYSNLIKDTGICKKPNGSIYSDDELRRCNPESIEVSEIPGTLRANIMEKIAGNIALNSVPKEDDTSCRNEETGKNFTYQEMKEKYDKAQNTQELKEASQLIKRCSALRIIPDALPAFKNEEALLAGLNKIFIVSGWEPESISPSGSTSATSNAQGLNNISVNVSVEANTGTTMRVLDNIERSIREFNIERATIEWGSNDTLLLRAQATAYYMDPSSIIEKNVTISPEDKK